MSYAAPSDILSIWNWNVFLFYMLRQHFPITSVPTSFVLALVFPFPVSLIGLMQLNMLQAVPIQFLHALLSYLGDSFSYDSSSSIKSPLASRPPSCYPGINAPSEGLVRWQLRLEYFAYETLQDLRIGKLFEIIVDYPERYVFGNHLSFPPIQIVDVYKLC